MPGRDVPFGVLTKMNALIVAWQWWKTCVIVHVHTINHEIPCAFPRIAEPRVDGLERDLTGTLYVGMRRTW